MKTGNLLLITNLLFSVLLFSSCEEKNSTVQKSILWEQGTGKYNNYRIL